MTKRTRLEQLFQNLYDAAEAINYETDDDDYEIFPDLLDECANIANELRNLGIVEDGIVTIR